MLSTTKTFFRNFLKNQIKYSNKYNNASLHFSGSKVVLVNFKVSGSSTFDAIFVLGSVREVLGAGCKWKGAQGFVGFLNGGQHGRGRCRKNYGFFTWNRRAKSFYSGA